jgi:LPXTG-site transpeptidase (sortase) family protein
VTRSRLNTLLLIAIIIVNAVTVGLPFVPSLVLKVQARQGQKERLEQKVAALETQLPSHGPNRLIMPSALFDQPVFDGADTRTLRQGVWHRPASSSPDKGGNTVFAAHRFTYSNPEGAFYHLDKLKLGDRIGVVWNDRMYRYRVDQVRVVGPHETAIEAATNGAQLTLYTCTPLAIPKDRLVVTAKPEVEHE